MFPLGEGDGITRIKRDFYLLDRAPRERAQKNRVAPLEMTMGVPPHFRDG
jgi:hypothetical protein